jgi:hypothetical protein
MQMNARQIGDRRLVEAAASRATVPVYHTGQGQDEHAAAHATCRQHHLPPHGLDAAWSWSGNPHRQRGDAVAGGGRRWTGRHAQAVLSLSAERTTRGPFGRLRWALRRQLADGGVEPPQRPPSHSFHA